MSGEWTKKGAEETGGDGYDYFDFGYGFMDVYIHQNVSNLHFKYMELIV